MAKLNYDALMQAVEHERLRLRAGKSNYAGEHYRIVTQAFARAHDDDALIRAAAEFGHQDSSDAKAAARVLETEYRLRESASRSTTERYGGWTLLIAILTLVAAIVAAVVGVLSLRTL
jgi:hypothetical protein